MKPYIGVASLIVTLISLVILSFYFVFIYIFVTGSRTWIPIDVLNLFSSLSDRIIGPIGTLLLLVGMSLGVISLYREHKKTYGVLSLVFGILPLCAVGVIFVLGFFSL